MIFVFTVISLVVKKGDAIIATGGFGGGGGLITSRISAEELKDV